jgi:predicted PurR-regulated permease PerM
MVTSRAAHATLVLLAILAVALLLDIALPFATTLFVAAVLAGALFPWTDQLAAALGGRRRLAAVLVTVAMLVSVVGPLSAVGAMLVPQAAAGVAWLRAALQSEGVAGLVARVPEALHPAATWLQQALPSSLERLQELVTAQGGRAAAVLGNVLTATTGFLLQSLLMLVALFFLLVDGKGLVDWFDKAIPLKRGQLAELLHDFRRVTVTVLVSTVATAGVQSVLALVGYLVGGVPNPVFFTLVTFILGLVPLLGATVVVLAIAALRLATGHIGSGIFLGIWGVAVVSMIDNVVKPLFIRGGVPIHGAVIFFALFGGIFVFGPVGFLVGPLAVTFLVAVVRMYRRDFGA